ncbi:MAG: type III-B CRISPR-associated protein Cas10/Cmr2 [Gammaproteobacteria bacterium]
MTPHLLVISLGPVQDFISAARRTRDLWFGSFLLSEISKAAARAVRDKGKLIFPNPTNPDKDLKPESAFNVVNIIVAELPVGLLPKDIATVAEKAAKECWKGYAAAAKTVADALIDKTTRSAKRFGKNRSRMSLSSTAPGRH